MGQPVGESSPLRFARELLAAHSVVDGRGGCGFCRRTGLRHRDPCPTRRLAERLIAKHESRIANQAAQR